MSLTSRTTVRLGNGGLSSSRLPWLPPLLAELLAEALELGADEAAAAAAAAGADSGSGDGVGDGAGGGVALAVEEDELADACPPPLAAALAEAAAVLEAAAAGAGAGADGVASAISVSSMVLLQLLTLHSTHAQQLCQGFAKQRTQNVASAQHTPGPAQPRRSGAWQQKTFVVEHVNFCLFDVIKVFIFATQHSKRTYLTSPTSPSSSPPCQLPRHQSLHRLKGQMQTRHQSHLLRL